MPHQGKPNPEKPHQRASGDLLALIALVAVLAVLLGGYLLFPWVQGMVGHADCIGSGRITGC
jgi:uncharacterized protein HemX